MLSCKFMTAAGYGATSDAIQCMDYCLEQGAAVISASWTCFQDSNPPLREAVERTHEAGVLLVLAAGNQGADIGKSPYYPQVSGCLAWLVGLAWMAWQGGQASRDWHALWQ